MPTTITSAGVTFTDTTTLTSANIGTAQLVNGSVTAEKLGTTEQKQICKAWVNFNGTTSPGTIRSSYNVSSVTKNGTGDYTVNFTTALADANYSVSGISQAGSNGTRITYLVLDVSVTTPTINSFRVVNYPSGDGTGAKADTTFINIQVFGN